MTSITLLDLLCLAIIVIGLLVDHFVVWAAFLRRSKLDPASARVWLWSAWIILLWSLAGAVILLWLYEVRAWSALGLIVPEGWRLLGAIVLVLALVATYVRTIAKIAHAPYSRRIGLQNQLGNAAALVLPHTRSELGLFVVLSLTAGFCEECIFRGYLISTFESALGWWGAAAISVIVFAAAHSYQGFRGALNAGMIGSVFTLVVLISGSLLPVIVLHAILDIGQGCVAWLVFRKVQGEGAQ